MGKVIKYLLDGVDFKDYGISVSKSKGLVDIPKLKEPNSVEFSGYHGKAVDLYMPRFQQREITLECFIKAENGQMAFVQQLSSFAALWTQKRTGNMPAGLHELTVMIGTMKPLIYMVYLGEGAAVEKTWNDNRMVGTFSLKLIEPEPVKKVIKFTSTNASISVTSDFCGNVYWGDGYMDTDISGNGITVSHSYSTSKEHYAVITGVIEEAYITTSNGSLIWDRL